MSRPRVIAVERILEPIIALAGCSKLQHITVAGSKSIELMFELNRRGYACVASSANCGHPAEQYDVALVDWRQRKLRTLTLHTLETTLDWLLEFLSPGGILVLWLDSQKPAANQEIRSALEARGLVVEAATVREDGSAFSARRLEIPPISKAA
jgi:hypothetical protein